MLPASLLQINKEDPSSSLKTIGSYLTIVACIPFLLAIIIMVLCILCKNATCVSCNHVVCWFFELLFTLFSIVFLVLTLVGAGVISPLCNTMTSDLSSFYSVFNNLQNGSVIEPITYKLNVSGMLSGFGG